MKLLFAGASIVRACRATPRCAGFTSWARLPGFFRGYGGAPPCDETNRPKPAVAAMIAAFTDAAP